MLNCLTADIRRVLKKKSYIILALVELLLIVGAAVVAFFFHKDGIDTAFSLAVGFALLPLIFLVGVPVFLAVFSDDFKSKAMQTSIGHGISRQEIVICRFLEVTIIIAQALFLYSAVIFGLSIWLDVSRHVFWEQMKILWENGLQLLCYSNIAMIVVFMEQKSTMGLVLFILLSTSVVSGILTLVSQFKIFAEHNIDFSVITVETLINKANDSSFAFAPLMWVALAAGYIVLPIILSILIFRHKELEF